MSEGFLSRWSRLKKRPGDAPATPEIELSKSSADGVVSRMTTEAVAEQVPAKLMPWAGVNPAYQKRQDEAVVSALPGLDKSQEIVGQDDTTRKVDEQKKVDPSAGVAGVSARHADLAAPSLPEIASLNMDSDFKPFMQSNVSAESRNAALKKLFTDPSFNVMDGLDTYVADYSLPDPIPAEMLKDLLKSKAFCLFDDPVEAEQVAQTPGGIEDGVLALGTSEYDAPAPLAVETSLQAPGLMPQSAQAQDLAHQVADTHLEILSPDALTTEEHLRLIPGPRVAQAPFPENEKQKGEIGG